MDCAAVQGFGDKELEGLEGGGFAQMTAPRKCRGGRVGWWFKLLHRL